ncbi:MAG: phosphoribosylformylglycinamidine synthase, partial [Planctomycetaceae bacterium]|nr:phosphoribosylformylglycinamidine synthase [Planctomycetaceae bacterium]
MLWEVEIFPGENNVDHEGRRVLSSAASQGIHSLSSVRSARSFLIEGDLDQDQANRAARDVLCDAVVESYRLHQLPTSASESFPGEVHLNVMLHAGVTDSVADNAVRILSQLGLSVTAVATCRKYWLNGELTDQDVARISSRVLANDAIEHVIAGPLQIADLSVGSDYSFELTTVAIREMDDAALTRLSAEGQLYLSLTEMQTIRDYFRSLDRDPTDIELETVAQTWSEHCSHKTLAGRIHYIETQNGQTVSDRHFDNMLKETIFRATVQIRESLGDDDWCVSVFKDNAGIVRFDEQQNVCFKVETHNHPSAIEPYGGANTGLGGVIRDPLGTGMGARPVCSTDVFCFAPPDTPADQLPPGVLHPRAVMQGVVAGVRDYGNRMGIPTVNGAVCFDPRYLGNPLVYCGNVAMIPVDQCEKHMQPGDLIVAVGGRTGRDGIHGATFSSAELTEESETISGGAVQIGNPVTEKMVADVILAARDRHLYSAITDCGAGGFSSAVGEMGEETGAEVWLDRAPLKYTGLSYTEIWISEAQERMVLAVPPATWPEFRDLCASEGVEATAIGQFTDTKELVLKYHDQEVGRVSMHFLHEGRPPVVREAVYEIRDAAAIPLPQKADYTEDLKAILGSLNVASKEWIIRQYDHEVQAGSVIKPLVGVQNDGPSDAAVVRPDLTSSRGLVVSCGINPHFGDADPWWMAASAIDEAIRNCVAVGADPARIAILDNFCWG